MTEQELEALIAPIIERKNAAEIDSPEWLFCIRVLRGLRYKYELAGGIMEDLDPIGWGCYCRPLE
jgi:hypothetical protein